MVFPGPEQLELAHGADPFPAAGEVVLKVESVGICGTDLHILDGDYIATYPAVPLHELAWRIVALGSEVTDSKVGQGVTADPDVYCGRCPECRPGLENLCRHAEAIGVNRPGAAAEYVAVPAVNCVSMPDYQLIGSSLVEPLSCALHGSTSSAFASPHEF